MSNLREIPFTEIVERARDLSKSNENVKHRLRGIVNEVATKDIPIVYDWSWLKSSSAISCIAEYTTGVVSISTQGTVCTFGSGAAITSAMTGRRIKFSSNSYVYDFTFSDSTGGTIDPPLSGSSNITSGAYTIFKNVFSLAPDHDRFPVNGGILFYSAGQPEQLPEIMDDDYYNDYATASPTTVPDGVRMLGYDTAGCQQFEVVPPPSSAYLLKNDYFKALTPMRETTAGTAAFVANSSNITGTDTVFTHANTGDYIRADNFGKGVDSTWYRIATITNDTSATLTTLFRSDSNYSGSYTLCPAPQMPSSFHEAIIYGTVQKVLPDQRDPMLALARNEYVRILSDNKIKVQSRHAKDTIELIAENYDYRR